jgi:hypothetical protein
MIWRSKLCGRNAVDWNHFLDHLELVWSNEIELAWSFVLTKLLYEKTTVLI